MKKEDVNKPLWYRGMKSIGLLLKYGSFTSKEYYDSQFKAYGKEWRSEHYKDVFNNLPKGRFNLLDIGCGMGEGCILLKDKFPESDITGVDISEVAIRNAKRQDKIKYFCLDFLKDDLPKDRWDIILIIDTLEHFGNPFEMLDKCLKYTNKVILRVPYKQNVRFKFLREHKFSFDKNTFKNYNSKVIKITTDVDYKGEYILFLINTKNPTKEYKGLRNEKI